MSIIHASASSLSLPSKTTSTINHLPIWKKNKSAAARAWTKFAVSCSVKCPKTGGNCWSVCVQLMWPRYVICHPRVWLTSRIPAEFAEHLAICLRRVLPLKAQQRGKSGQNSLSGPLSCVQTVSTISCCACALSPVSNLTIIKNIFEKLLGDLAELNLNLDCPDWPDKGKEVWRRRLGILPFLKCATSEFGLYI